MNRQARLAGKDLWFSWGEMTHAEAAKRLVCWHDRIHAMYDGMVSEFLHSKYGELPEGTAWVVETRDVDHPDTIMRHQVSRQIVYSVKCYRGDEANA